MADLFSGDPVTEEEAERAEEMASGRVCPVCGRTDDWLCRGRYGDFIYLDCDDCGQSITKVRMPAAPPTT